MLDSFYVAWRYLAFHKARTATLVACVTLLAALPLALQVLLEASERQLRARAEATPLLLGAKGSALDLVMNALYFADAMPAPISMAAQDQVDASALALPIPLYVRFQARGFPIVGTTLDYFDFRGLEIARGRPLAMLGEALVGAEVAARLGLTPGDGLLSSPETVFDLAGVYPLKLRVVGVLAPSRSPDDRAVFVDVKTAWVVEGLVHGHADLGRRADDSVIIEQTEGNTIASAKLAQYTEITEANIASFHFHGDPAGYPLNAVIVVAQDAKSGTLLRGRYLNGESPHQLVLPGAVIDGLLADVFRIKRVLDAVIGVVGLATLLALALVFTLSVRLRQREIHTLFRIGCSRFTIARLLGAEMAIIATASAGLCGAALTAVHASSDELVRRLFFG